jgi:hypothetical protein
MQSVEYQLTEHSYATGHRLKQGDFMPLSGRQVLAAHRAQNEMDMRLAGDHFASAKRLLRANKGNEERRIG